MLRRAQLGCRAQSVEQSVRWLTQGNFSTAKGSKMPGGGESPGMNFDQTRSGSRVSDRLPKGMTEERAKYYQHLADEAKAAKKCFSESHYSDDVGEQPGEGGQQYFRDLRPPPLGEGSRDSRPTNMKEIDDMGVRTPTRSPAPGNVDQTENVTGDSYGLYETRTSFYAPIARNMTHSSDELGNLFPPNTPPERCVAPQLVRQLATRFGVSCSQVAVAMLEANHDINQCLGFLQNFKAEECESENQTRVAKGLEPINFGTPVGDFGLVAIEAYDPETFCLVNFNLPTLEATRDVEILEVIHELTLSAAEVPVDTPKDKLVDRFVKAWTIEDGTPVKDVLNEYGISVRDMMMLPYGEYSVQGMFVHRRVHEEFPNIGTGACAFCLDLRSGIHNRFRFHAERIADSLSEHVMREHHHFNQDVHLLRQPFWFKPDCSIEDYIRLKENLMSPSLGIFEMRYAVMSHGHPMEPYRNIVEMEQLRVMQNKMEKTWKEVATTGNGLNTWTGMSDVQSSPCTAPIGGFFGDGTKKGAEKGFDDLTSAERTNFEKAGITTAHERIWQRFYRKNTY